MGEYLSSWATVPPLTAPYLARMKNQQIPSVPGGDFKDEVLARLAKALPPVFARHAVPMLLGGAIAAGTLANLGKEAGPSYIKMGRNAVYERESFLAWLATRIKP